MTDEELTPLRIPTLSVLGGTLGITLCPGRQSRGILGMPPRHLGDDLAVVTSEGFQRVGVLLEDDELTRIAPDLLDAYAENAIAVHRFPIPDFHVPVDAPAYRVFVDELASHLGRGEKVLVHCKGGLGRAGLTAACLLTLDGRAADQAIREVRAVRPGAIENRDQERFAAAFAEGRDE